MSFAASIRQTASTARCVSVAVTATDQTTIRRRGTGLRLSDPTKACPGYTLFAPLTGAGEGYLVDLAGNIAHAWTLSYPPGLHGYLLPTGHLFSWVHAQ